MLYDSNNLRNLTIKPLESMGIKPSNSLIKSASGLIYEEVVKIPKNLREIPIKFKYISSLQVRGTALESFRNFPEMCESLYLEYNKKLKFLEGLESRVRTLQINNSMISFKNSTVKCEFLDIKDSTILDSSRLPGYLQRVILSDIKAKSLEFLPNCYALDLQLKRNGIYNLNTKVDKIVNITVACQKGTAQTINTLNTKEIGYFTLQLEDWKEIFNVTNKDIYIDTLRLVNLPKSKILVNKIYTHIFDNFNTRDLI